MTKNKTFNGQKFQDWCIRYWAWAVVIIIILSASAIRIHLLEVPFERDEGEYAYAGQLILQGVPPYAEVYNMKMPGIYAAYALIMAVFGQTHWAIHLGLLIVNAATALLLFLLGRKLFNAFTGVTAAAAFALLSLGQQVQGIFANAEHFVILSALGGILLLVRAIDSNKLPTLLAGALLLGLGFMMKQHGIAFIAFGGLYLFFREIGRRPLKWGALAIKCMIFLAGVTLPFALTCFFLKLFGVFDKFWFWTFDYASKYVSSIPFDVGMENLKEQLVVIAGSSAAIWIMAVLGLTSLLWNKRARDNFLFSALFFVFSFLAIFPGFYFRPHYFILFLPGVAFLAGIGAGSIYDLFSRNKVFPAVRMIPVLLVVSVLFHGAWQQREFLFFMEPDKASRMTYGLNPFPESLEIARFLKANSNEDDRIAIIGSEPQIYFYSNRRSATGHIYTYALMETHSYALTMQKEMIREIENANPKYLIFVNIPTSWLVRMNSERLIFKWFNNYAQKNYELAGIVDIGVNQTNYLWNQDVTGYKIQSPYWLSIFRRKG